MKTPPLGNRDLMRAMNRSLILNVIKSRGPIARAEVARHTGLSPATVTGITADLIVEELIFEKEQGDSSGGRPPILLSINPRGAFVVGIKLTEEAVIGALTDLEATVITHQSHALAARTPEVVVNTIAALVDDLLQRAHLDGALGDGKLLGVGVGLAGIIDSTHGILRQSPYYNWVNLPIRDLLRARLHVPVYVDNDVNTLTQAEKWFGSGQGVENFIVVTVGRGVGMGMVINGQFYRGAGGGAGEFGHTVVQPGGRLCDCGRYGCIETYVSEPALLLSAREASAVGALPAVETLDDLLAVARAGNATAQAIFTAAGELLGMAIANLVNILNPGKVVLGGEGMRMGDLFFEPMLAAIQQNVYASLLADVQVHLEPWGDDAWARGAASLVLSELFESPLYREAVALQA